MKFDFLIPSLRGGGAEKAVITLGSLLASRGHGVNLTVLEDIQEHAQPQGVQLTVFARSGGRISHGFLGKRVAAARLRQLLGTGSDHDMIVSTLPFADEIAHLARLPMHWCRIANTLSSEIDLLGRAHPAKARRRMARYRRLYGEHSLIAVSKGVARDLRDRIGVTRRIEVIPNVLDTAAIRGKSAQSAPGIPDRDFVIHVGRFAAQKRHDLLLDAWARVDLSALLVLLGPQDPRLDNLIAARGLSSRVRVVPFQPNPYPWIARARLLVLSSDHEGLPNVLLEALACGTPVVSTDCPSGPAEILEQIPECLVPCGDPDALAAAIARTFEHPPSLERANLGRYAPDVVAKAWEALASGRPQASSARTP